MRDSCFRCAHLRTTVLSFRSCATPVKLPSCDYHVRPLRYVKQFYNQRYFNSGHPPAYSTPHEPSDKQDRVMHKRDFFPLRRFRPVPLTEDSLANIKGQLASR